MAHVELDGSLKEQFGQFIYVNAHSLVEVVKAVDANRPGFKQALRSNNKFEIYRSDGFKMKANKTDFRMKVKEAPNWKITPVISGSGGQNPTTTIAAGILIVAAAVYLGPAGAGYIGGGLASQIGTVGVGIALIGVSSAFYQNPNETVQGLQKDKPSYLQNGPVNNIMVGGGVPILYGTSHIGSQVISNGVRTEDIGTYE